MHVLPPSDEAQFNYIIDIEAKWHRNYFYFFSIYACPGPSSLSPTFESKFARMEPLGGGMLALSFMRHTEEWVDLGDARSVDESPTIPLILPLTLIGSREALAGSPGSRASRA
jgi:hypothetical protein